MKQADIDRAVARATGETVARIKQLGFLLIYQTDRLEQDANESDPFVINEDGVDGDRINEDTWRPHHDLVTS